MKNITLVIIMLVAVLIGSVSCVNKKPSVNKKSIELSPNIFNVSNASDIEKIYLELKSYIGEKSEYETIQNYRNRVLASTNRHVYTFLYNDSWVSNLLEYFPEKEILSLKINFLSFVGPYQHSFKQAYPFGRMVVAILKNKTNKIGEKQGVTPFGVVSTYSSFEEESWCLLIHNFDLLKKNADNCNIMDCFFHIIRVNGKDAENLAKNIGVMFIVYVPTNLNSEVVLERSSYTSPTLDRAEISNISYGIAVNLIGIVIYDKRNNMVIRKIII